MIGEALTCRCDLDVDSAIVLWAMRDGLGPVGQGDEGYRKLVHICVIVGSVEFTNQFAPIEKQRFGSELLVKDSESAGSGADG